MTRILLKGCETFYLMNRIGLAGLNFKRALVFLLSFFREYRIVLLDSSDEFSCVARISGARYYNVAKHSINPVKPPCWEMVEQYVESLVEVIDYCFGTFNMKSIITKSFLSSLSSSSEITIPEITSRLDFENPEGGLSIYTPLEPFTFGTLRKVFGRREELDFNEILETGIIFDLSGLPTASSKLFTALTVLNKLMFMKPKHPTVIVVTYPSMIWPKSRRRDAAQLHVEQVMLEELERKGFVIVFAEKTFSELSERIIYGLDAIVFSPPSEVLDPWNPWGSYTRLEKEMTECSAVILNREGEIKPLTIPANIMIKPLDDEEREKLKPALRVFKESDRLREILNEDYESGMRIINRLKELDSRAVLNRLIEEVRSTIGASGLRALATLLRHGYLRQVREGDEQYIVLSRGDWE
ncbi:MAG: hypothetical protein QXN75_02305 [Thermoproteota archaeon]